MKFTILTLFLSLAVFGQTILDENFEDGIPTTWELQQENPEETWKTASGYEYFFTSVAAVDGNASLQDEWLVSPSFSLEVANSPVLEFISATSHLSAVQFDAFDLLVHISTDNGATWNQIWEDAEMPWGANFIPFLTSVDLSPYIGETNLKIAFQYTGTDGASFMLDRVTVQANADYCSYFFPDNKIEPITRVVLANLDHSSPITAGAQESHELFLEQIVNMMPGDAHDLEVYGVTGFTGLSKFVVFFDWNQDNFFDYDTEMIEIGMIENSNGEDGIKAVTQILVPEDALEGFTRMRIIKINIDGFPEACVSNIYEYGQAEDYTVRVGEPLSTFDFVDKSLSIYPNPVINNMKIQHTDLIWEVILTDLSGKVYLRQKTNSSKVELSMNNLPKGIYIIQAKTKEGVLSSKVVKK